MKSRKTTTRHYHLRRTRLSGMVPVTTHLMNYWGVTAIPRGKRKGNLVSKYFTSPKQANSFKQALIQKNKLSKTGPIWRTPKVIRLKDTDLDGVPDVTDCAPNDITRQGLLHDLSNSSRYIKTLAAREKQELNKKLREIDRILHDREYRHKLTREEKTKIVRITNTFKKEHPLVTASIKGVVLGGEVALLLAFSGASIRVLLRPRTLAAISRITIPRVSPFIFVAPKKILKERLFTGKTLDEIIGGGLRKKEIEIKR